MPPSVVSSSSALKRSQRCRNLFLNKQCRSSNESTISLPLALNTTNTNTNETKTMCVLDKNASITYLGVYEANPVEYRRKYAGSLFNITPSATKQHAAYNSDTDTDVTQDTTVWCDDDNDDNDEGIEDMCHKEKLMHLLFKLFDIKNQESISFGDVKSVFEMLNKRYERGYTFEDAFVFFYSLFDGEGKENVSSSHHHNQNDEDTISYEQFRRGFLENFL